MWWEAVPAGAIIFGCFVVPEVFSYYYCWWWQGTVSGRNNYFMLYLTIMYLPFFQPFKRIDMSRWDVYNIIRDERITGEKKIKAATRYHFVVSIAL